MKWFRRKPRTPEPVGVTVLRCTSGKCGYAFVRLPRTGQWFGPIMTKGPVPFAVLKEMTHDQVRDWYADCIFETVRITDITGEV